MGYLDALNERGARIGDDMLQRPPAMFVADSAGLDFLNSIATPVDTPIDWLKAGEGPACTLLFADHTRGHQRRWCSMAMCGNRAKQAAHRERVKARRG